MSSTTVTRDEGPGGARGAGRAEGERPFRLSRLGRWHYHVWRAGLHFIMRVVFGLRVENKSAVPREGALLIAANHASYLDPPAVGGPISHRALTYIAKAELFRFGPFARLISSFNSIPIRSGEPDTVAIKETLRRLEGGEAVLIFPEGGRSPDGEIHPFKRGAALLLKKSRCPVLPVGVYGTFEAWPSDASRPRLLGNRVRVRYGRVIPYEEIMRDGPDAALARLEREVRALFESLRAEEARRRAAPWRA